MLVILDLTYTLIIWYQKIGEGHQKKNMHKMTTISLNFNMLTALIIQAHLENVTMNFKNHEL